MSLNCRELRLEEMLGDSIIKAVMEADGVDSRELEASCGKARAIARDAAHADSSGIRTVRSSRKEWGSHEVPNRCLVRHCVDCCLSRALPLCSQRFDHVEIASVRDS